MWRNGLTETELIDLLGIQARATWSVLHIAISEVLVNKAGILTFHSTSLSKVNRLFFHLWSTSIFQAVEQRYLKEVSQRQQAHVTLSNYFEKQVFFCAPIQLIPWQKVSKRNCLELPYHYVESGNKTKLKAFLSNLDNFTILWNSVSSKMLSMTMSAREIQFGEILEIYWHWQSSHPTWVWDLSQSSKINGQSNWANQFHQVLELFEHNQIVEDKLAPSWIGLRAMMVLAHFFLMRLPSIVVFTETRLLATNSKDDILIARFHCQRHLPFGLDC